MSITLRVVLIVFALAFFFEIFKLVSRGKLQLKYSLLWMVLSLALMLCAVFPDLVGYFSDFLGIEAPSNLVFLIAIVALVGICLSLTAIVSWQSRDIRLLIQRVALLEKRLGEPDASSEEDDEADR